MSKPFKIMLSIALSMLLTVILCSCWKESSSNAEYYGDYHDGYSDGYADGTNRAAHQISGYLEERFNDAGLANDIEEAIQTLTNYADGEPISKQELQKAIWSVSDFYYDTCDIVFNIDDYVVD